MPIEIGTVIAKRYRVVRQLGKGGMGEVFAAENTRTGRRVALKVLRAESKQKQSAIERFRREARAAGAISSDFVTQVLDVEDDTEYGIVLVFELLEGESLVDRLKRTGPVAFDELWGIVEAVWMGLADAHAAGIVHRDLKPSNVFLEQRRGGRRVKILDFGISKLPKKISTQSLTQVGQSLGTFSFMPPEQIGKAKTVDHRADIYACATLIYQALSGKLPYQAKNVVAMMELKNKTEPRTLGEAMKTPVEPRLEQFIARGLARNPDVRFQTALDALEAWRVLRPPGALSIMDLDASGTYPGAGTIEDVPSSGEIKTTVLHNQNIRERLRELEQERGVPATLRQGGGTYPTSPSPIDSVPPTVITSAANTVRTSAQHAHSGTDVTRTQPSIPALPSPAPPTSQPPSGTFLEGVSHPSAGPGPSQPAPRSVPPHHAPPHSAPPTTSGSGVRDFKASEHQLVMIQPPRNRFRTTVTLVLGALGLMLVGFVMVAVVLHLLGPN